MAVSFDKTQKRKYFESATTESNELFESLTTDSNAGASTSSMVKIQPPAERRSFSMKEKLQILECLDMESINSVCTKFGLHQSVLRRWQQKKEEIKEICEKDNLKNQKKKRTAANVDIDDGLYLWFLQARVDGIPISMSILQNKALELNVKLGGNKNFRASNGWFYRWKLRKGIRRLTVPDEKLPANTEPTDKNDKIDFANIVKDEKLARDQIFNFYETGLWYKLLAKESFAAMPANQASSLKKQKKRLKIGACCSVDDSIK